MPATRQEVKNFHNRLKTEAIPWVEAYRQKNPRKQGEDTIYQVYEGKSCEGYRIVW